MNLLRFKLTPENHSLEVVQKYWREIVLAEVRGQRSEDDHDGGEYEIPFHALLVTERGPQVGRSGLTAQSAADLVDEPSVIVVHQRFDEIEVLSMLHTVWAIDVRAVARDFRAVAMIFVYEGWTIGEELSDWKGQIKDHPNAVECVGSVLQHRDAPGQSWMAKMRIGRGEAGRCTLGQWEFEEAPMKDFGGRIMGGVSGLVWPQGGKLVKGGTA